MSENETEGVKSSVPHGPLVSESLKAAAAEHAEEAGISLETGRPEPSGDEHEPQGEPLKQHGDALLEGNGSRHGESPPNV